MSSARFVYVSALRADTGGKSKNMWAKVRHELEDDLEKLCKHSFMVRPGVLLFLHGIALRTRWYRILYALTGPGLPWLRRAFPRYVTTTEQLGRAMLKVGKDGFARHAARCAILGRWGPSPKAPQKVLPAARRSPGTGLRHQPIRRLFRRQCRRPENSWLMQLTG